MNESTISIFKNITQTTGGSLIAIDQFLTDIQEGKWQDIVNPIRIIQDHDQRQVAKKKLPYVTISGIFAENRSVKGLSRHSGFISMDLDGLGNELEGIKTLLAADPFVYSAFVSASGTGLCVLFRIDPEKHREAFDGLADYLIKQYQVVVDPSGKDVSRPRYVSYDPHIFINDRAAKFKKYLPKPKAKKIQATIFVQSEFDEVIQKMVDANVSCVEDYRDWVDIGFGLADQFGEGGRSYYHSLSACSDKYETSMCDRQYTFCLRGNGKSGAKITIATIYWYAKQAGINVLSDKTKKVAAATSSLKKSGLDAADIISNLEKFDGITGVDDIVRQAFAANQSFAPGESIVENVRTWIRHNYTIKRNVITRKLEVLGKPIEDIEINTMFLDAKIIFDDLTFDLFCKILFSTNTEAYHPIMDWFEANKAPGREGVIDSFFQCFKTKDEIGYFGKKWLVGAISCIHGIHSPLMLILAGEKQGTGKTEAFRRMLPPELRAYYAESKLDAGKDDEILMTQKWFIIDDEMGGKSKKESKRLKELTSKQTFTLREPYGRMNVDLNRIACLGGTTNDLGVLYDLYNRRQLPMEIEAIDIPAYNAINKTDLIMEAWHLYKDGYMWELNGEDTERLAGKTDKFEEICPEREVLANFFIESAHNWMSATMIKNRMETLTVQKFSLKRIGMELRRLGYERVKHNGYYGYNIEQAGGPVAPPLDTTSPPW